MLQQFSHTAHDRYFSRTQCASAKKWKTKTSSNIQQKHPALFFGFVFNNWVLTTTVHTVTQYDSPQFTPSWRINCRIALAWWILSKSPCAAKSNCVIDLLFSLAYLYFCLLFEHLVPLVLSLPCLQSHHLANQTFFHSVKLRCALSRACPLQLHPAGEPRVVEDKMVEAGSFLPSSKRQKWCYLTEKHDFFQAPSCMQHASSFHHASWIFVLKAVLVHTPAFHELNFFVGNAVQLLQKSFPFWSLSSNFYCTK